MRRLLALTLLLLLPGCATTWAAFEVTGVDWHQGHFVDEVEALGPAERRVRVKGTYQPAAPVAVAASVADSTPPPPPPEPGPVSVVTEPPPVSTLPGRPLPEGGVSLACTVEQRNSKERTHLSLVRYDGTWKAITAFAFVSEVAISSLLIWSSTKKATVDGVSLGIGAFIGLDALGVAALFFHPREVRQRVEEGPGTWRTQSTQCPDGLVVEAPTGDFAVQPDGRVPALEPWMLQVLVEKDDASLPLRVGDARAAYQPSHAERCAWSDAARSPAPFCRGTRRAEPPGDAPLALPAP